MERVPINAPQGPLGLIFEPESTVLSKVRETSPLYGRVEVGWTLVGVVWLPLFYMSSTG